MAERMADRPDALLAFSDAVLIDAARRAALSRSRWRVAGFGHREWASMADDPLGQMLARQIVSGCTAAMRKRWCRSLLPFPEGLHPALGDDDVRPLDLPGGGSCGNGRSPFRSASSSTGSTRANRSGSQRFRSDASPRAPRSSSVSSSPTDPNGPDGPTTTRPICSEIAKRLESCDLDSGDSMLRLRLGRRAPPNPRGAREITVAKRARDVGRHYVDEDGYRRFALGLATAVSDWAR